MDTRNVNYRFSGHIANVKMIHFFYMEQMYYKHSQTPMMNF